MFTASTATHILIYMAIAENPVKVRQAIRVMRLANKNNARIRGELDELLQLVEAAEYGIPDKEE